MDNPRYFEVNQADQVEQAFGERSTVWFVVVGNEPWAPKAIAGAKDKATDMPTYMVVWVKNPDNLSAILRPYLLGTATTGAFALGTNLGIAAHLDQVAAVRPTKILEAFGQAESYSGPGFCLQHGAWQGTACSQCPPGAALG